MGSARPGKAKSWGDPCCHRSRIARRNWDRELECVEVDLERRRRCAQDRCGRVGIAVVAVVVVVARGGGQRGIPSQRYCPACSRVLLASLWDELVLVFSAFADFAEIAKIIETAGIVNRRIDVNPRSIPLRRWGYDLWHVEVILPPWIPCCT